MASDVEKSAWVERVLGLVVPTLSAEQIDDLRAELDEVLADAGEDLPPELRATVDAAAEALRAGKLNAADLMDDIADALAERETADETAEVEKEADREVDEVVAQETAAAEAGRKLAALRSSCAAAAVNLVTATQALFHTEQLQQDPRSDDPSVQAALDDVADFVPAVDAVAEAVAKAAANGNGASEEALKAIALYRSELDATPALTAFENTEAGAFPIFSLIDEALTALEMELSTVH